MSSIVNNLSKCVGITMFLSVLSQISPPNVVTKTRNITELKNQNFGDTMKLYNSEVGGIMQCECMI